ncbi:hypothetical protein ACM26V_22895 [Salipaludibacillus sp. HK11]|uniref:hypothetical protein n=1 Tax=Salipaludibacillus sp. HK11 TaxID=3394320 RepID=UPI0039FD652B
MSQAKRELSFPILFPETILEDWTIEETIFEDRLLVTSFKNNDRGTIELIQDQNIQGLDEERLRNHLIFNESPTNLSQETEEIVEIYNYVGEMAYFMEPNPIVQFTFVVKNDLLAEVNDIVPNYQIIGKEISTDELRKFISTLEVST